jgi:hypothetical protein
MLAQIGGLIPIYAVHRIWNPADRNRGLLFSSVLWGCGVVCPTLKIVGLIGTRTVGGHAGGRRRYSDRLRGNRVRVCFSHV